MKNALVVGITLLAGAFAVASCKQGEGAGKGAPGAGSASARPAVTYAVDVMKVESRLVDYVVQAPGTLDAFERVQVTARVSGVIDKVRFTEGQQVKKGDLLVVIESERYQLAVNSAKAVLDKANASLADAEAMVARREKAIAEHPGLIPGEELATFKTKALIAKADAAAAAEALRVANVNLRDAHVRAPIDGVMQTRTVETGQYVQPGYLMASLLRDDPMLLRFQVEPRDAPRLKPDMLVTFTMRETQRTYQAKITLVAGAADPSTRTVRVTAQVVTDGHKYWLRPGSFCDVSIAIAGTRPAEIIPRTAARATDRGYIVYVVQDGVAVERPVTLGMNTKDGLIEVRSGLEAGDLVVVAGAEALSTGARVKVNKTIPLQLAASPAPSASVAAPGSVAVPSKPAASFAGTTP